MDIEALRKVNNLALELQKHGIAASSEDAYKQAEQMIYHQEQPPTVEMTPTEQKHTMNDTLLEKKYELLLTMNTKHFENKIQLLNENLTNLTNEIAILKTKFATLNSHQQPIVEQKEKPEPPAPDTTPQLPPPKKEEHPRQGSYTPGDISIEKMFYCGNR